MLPLLRFMLPVVRRFVRPLFIRVLLVVPAVLRFVPAVAVPLVPAPVVPLMRPLVVPLLSVVPMVLRRVVEAPRVLRLRVLRCVRLLARPEADMRLVEVVAPTLCWPDIRPDWADTGSVRVPQIAVAAKRHAVFLNRNIISISFVCGISAPLGYG
jgi:hypothetical protein